MSTALTPQASTTACPQCELKVQEIARLRSELAELQQRNAGTRQGRWLVLAAMGVVLLTTLPHAPLVILYVALGLDLENKWFGYAMWGLLIRLPWAQWSLIGIFCMLHEGPLWQRAIMIGAAIFNAVGYFWLRMLGYELRTG